MDTTDKTELITRTATKCLENYLQSDPGMVHGESPLPTKLKVIETICGWIAKDSGLEFLPLDSKPATLGELITALCARVKES